MTFQQCYQSTQYQSKSITNEYQLCLSEKSGEGDYEDFYGVFYDEAVDVLQDTVEENVAVLWSECVVGVCQNQGQGCKDAMI